MQSDPSPLGNLKTYSKITATYRARQIVWVLEANWANDTTDWSNGAWTDETRYLEAVSGDGQIFPFDQSLTSLGAIPPWSMKAGLRNTGGRFSPQRVDGPLYASIQNYKIVYTPVRFWMGIYYPAGATLDTPTTLNGNYFPGDTLLTFNASLNKGEIVRLGSEDMLVTTSGTTVRLVRAIHNTFNSSKSNGTSVSRVGGMTLQFAGVINVPQDGAKDFNSGWDCFDRLGLVAQGEESTIAYTDAFPEDVVTNFLAAIPSARGYEPIPSPVLEKGFFRIGVSYLDKEPVVREAQKAMSGDGGILFADKSGVVRGWNMQHWLGASSAYTFDHPNVLQFTTAPDPASLFSEVNADFAPRNIGATQVVHTQSDTAQIAAATSAAYGVAQTCNGAVSSTTSGAITVSGTAIANGDVVLVDKEQWLAMSGGGTVNVKFARAFGRTGSSPKVTTLNGGISAAATSIVIVGTAIAQWETIQLDQELMFVIAVAGSTLTVIRGIAGTTAVKHLTAAAVYRLTGATHANGATISKVTATTYSTNVRLDYGCTTVTTPVGGPPGGDLHHPVADTRDFVCSTGGGTDYTAAVSLSTFTATAQSVDVTFSNWSTTYGVFLTRFQIRGAPVLGSPTRRVVVKRSPSPPIPHRVRTIGGNARNWNSQTEVQTLATINMLADRWSILRPVYLAKVRGVPMLEPGDVVTFSESTLVTSAVTAIVLKVHWGLPGLGSGKETFEQDLVCIDYSSFYAGSNTAKIGTTALGTGTFFY